MKFLRLAPLVGMIFLAHGAIGAEAVAPAAGVLGTAAATAATAAKLPNSGLDLSAFEPKVRAQDDLFRAANGTWLNTASIPADKSAYGVFEQLADKS
ncbi:MAG: M13 family peptidase, partial [Burkholderiaceae bacterium]|nr:M13 family peptidase [Burkholderiaceae bacterium]